MAKEWAIGVYKNNKRIGMLHGEDDGKYQTLTFKTRAEAQTAANIESTQMEAVGHRYRPINIVKEAHRFRKKHGLE